MALYDVVPIGKIRDRSSRLEPIIRSMDCMLSHLDANFYLFVVSPADNAWAQMAVTQL